ncbi:MAG TPA: NAD(+) synthase [Vicinamibacterales bacterium]|jgi:NAD+ synthase|nr:NAD(+) synthase [Vicinamibacterales bacterium]
MNFDLQIDPPAAARDIEASIRDIVLSRLRRKGVVVGLSGGVDSSVVAALSARALGAERVLGLLMPEADSSPESLRLGRMVAQQLGIRSFVEDVSGILDAAGCYRRRDEAIRSLVPEYHDGWRCKLVFPDLVDRAGYAVYSLVLVAPSGAEMRVRLTADAYLGIVAATNFKQRVRKMMEYYYADRWRFAVAGTPNLLEYDQGFFVKNGDGAADLKPIAHLYKSQVYQLAEYLDLPGEIRRRPPTTDTYPLEQSQEEFYFGLSLQKTDMCLYARDHDVPAAEAAPWVGLTTEQVERVYAMIDSKREAARYLHAPPLVSNAMTTESLKFCW